MCGYQGWFTTPGDGSDRGWRHYSSKGQFKPGSCNIDLWPDMSELDEDEKYPTSFQHKDGRPAAVFSSYQRKTVLRHFRWMEQYGIDGVFVQRFAVETIATSGTCATATPSRAKMSGTRPIATRCAMPSCTTFRASAPAAPSKSSRTGSSWWTA